MSTFWLNTGSCWAGGEWFVGHNSSDSHAHARLKAAITRQFSDATWERCRVYFMCNIGSAVRREARSTSSHRRSLDAPITCWPNRR
ncbi:hypothetical protein EAH80_11820 [Mycobacterium hodleri]|uniref:Transposase n=1 Tax=Mycolicibacterium hodleri TaxID=49897 RepID=A0A502EA62_9MYCO|nr:hypothetical protein EAH80_11820 [Mycolicibacterium hodleri]